MLRYFQVIATAVILITVLYGLQIYNSKGTPKTQNNNSWAIQKPEISTVASNLEVPWALAFLPDNSILITERKGTVRILKDKKLSDVAKINVKQTGESGLHGLTVDPKFDQNHYIYLYYTYSADGNNSFNRVSRFTFENDSLKDEKIIVDKIPGAVFHDGGRIKFGPDGALPEKALYITTGDAGEPSRSQDKNSLAGKILRIKDGEKVKIFSYGHRNPQGIAWDTQGMLWETEHGQSATDELNLIEEGKNYGWPDIRGDQRQEGMESPRIQSGSATWAPAGLAFFNGSLYFGGLRGMALFQYNIETKEFKEHFKGQFGRIREVVLGPDNMLYITTSNRDGRGSPSPDDDKIIRINPSRLP